MIDGNEKLTRAMCAALKDKMNEMSTKSHQLSTVLLLSVVVDIKWHQNIAPFTSILLHQHKIRKSHSV